MDRFVKVFAISVWMVSASACSWLQAYEPPLVQGVLIEPEKLEQLQVGLS